MPTILLHPYVPRLRPADQQPTWEALAALERSFLPVQFHVPMTDWSDYWGTITTFWDVEADVVICEHDCAPTPAQAWELLSCAEPWCAFDYVLSAGMLWSTFPDVSCLGFSKLGLEARRKVAQRPPLPRHPHNGLDAELVRIMGLAHVHKGPLVHHHKA